jgi:LysM repeat protein
MICRSVGRPRCPPPAPTICESMKSFNPIIPPGSPLERSIPGRRSKLVVTVSIVLAIHVVLLAGLLMQGCKRETPNGAASPDSTVAGGATPSTAAGAASPSTDQPPPLGASEPASNSAAPPLESLGTGQAPTNFAASELPPSPAGNVPAKPTPAPSKTSVKKSSHRAKSHSGHLAVAEASPTNVYKVKAGDTLTKIARAHGTTVKALQSINGLTTDRLLVGQKLKLPPSKAATITHHADQASPTNSVQ